MAGRGWRQVHYVSLAFTPFGPTRLKNKEAGGFPASHNKQKTINNLKPNGHGIE